MSYDLQITKGLDGFVKLIQKKGASEFDGEYVLTNDTPYLNLFLSKDMLSVSYFCNHYVTAYAFDTLIEGLEKVKDFEFTNLQDGKTFTKSNLDEITNGYILSQGLLYAKVNESTLKQNKGQKEVTLAGRSTSIPLKFSLVEKLSRDLYFKKGYQYNLSLQNENAFFPSPFLWIDPDKKDYVISYTWTEFLDMVFPVNVKIDYITYVNNVESPKPTVEFYKYEDFVSILPKPETKDIPGLGERICYFDIETDRKKYEKALAKFDQTEIPLEYQRDSNLYTVYSMPD